MSLAREKLQQAVELVAQTGLDVWLTFVRETAEAGDPILPLILDGGLTWQTALMVSKDGQRVAVLGNYDADPLVASGNWTRVVPYVQGIQQPLLEELETLTQGIERPRIAVNYSTDDVKCDGLSHGMFLLLESYLEGTRFAGCLESAECIVGPLRGIKSQEEVARIKGAINETEKLFAEIEGFACPGVSERDVYNHVQSLIKARGLGFAWGPHGDPIVNSGPHSMIGHGVPSDEIRLEEGHVFHIDLGVLKEGYASDLQRCWYVGHSIPADVSKALDAVNASISAAAAAMTPGTPGWQVDKAARTTLTKAGYPEYMHAAGHQVGRVAHDGGAVLGPRWERYGRTPYMPIRVGEVYTLELGVVLPERGYLGIEEMVRVGSGGAEWLSSRQIEMKMIREA